MIVSLTWDERDCLYFGCNTGWLTVVAVVADKVPVSSSSLPVCTVLDYWLDSQPYHSEGFRASQKSIQHIAISNARNRLALGGEDEVTLWSFKARKCHFVSFLYNRPPKIIIDDSDPYHDWTFIRKLGNPQDENDEMNVVVTGLEWAYDHTMHLVASYLKQGIV